MIWRVILFWLLGANLAWADSFATSFTYTQTGQLASETSPWTNDTLTYAYNQGHRTNLNLTQTTESWNQGYTYDSAWRLQTLLSPAGAFGYTPGGASAASLLTKFISLPNGASISNNYDSMARLNYTGLLNQWNHPLDSYAYQFDLWGLRTNITRGLGLTTNNVTALYDGIGELATWNAKEATGTARQNEQISYGYDAANNLTNRTSGALVQTFTINPLNQISNISRTGTLTVTGATPGPVTNVFVNGFFDESGERTPGRAARGRLRTKFTTFTTVPMSSKSGTPITTFWLPTREDWI
jgi:YD repeat-containing protein